MAINFILPLRIAQELFAILVLGLSAYVASVYNSNFNVSPSQINFLIFTGVWTTFLAVPYLVLSPRFYLSAAHKYAILAVEAVTMLFWFAGFIAAACYVSDYLFCGANVCRCAQAAVVFGAFNWVLFAITTAMATIHVWRTRNSNMDGPAKNMEVNTSAVV